MGTDVSSRVVLTGLSVTRSDLDDLAGGTMTQQAHGDSGDRRGRCPARYDGHHARTQVGADVGPVG